MTSHLDAVAALQRVAAHVIARARVEDTGRFSLRVTPGGFGTPEFGDGPRRVRVAGNVLIVEDDRAGAAAARSAPLQGATLADLAAFAGVDLTRPLDVGHDTPPLGDPTAVIDLDDDAGDETRRAFALGAAALDLVVAALPAGATPTLARLWPEHFDVALDAEARAGVRVNLGVSPGDGWSSEPYAYVGPWTPDRPGDDAFWNAPFGATRTLGELGHDASVVAGFLLDGVDRLRTS
jgi:hypothetical protein